MRNLSPPKRLDRRVEWVPGVEHLGRESVLSSPCSDKVKNEWIYTSALLCLRDVHRKALNVGSKQIAADPIRH